LGNEDKEVAREGERNEQTRPEHDCACSSIRQRKLWLKPGKERIMKSTVLARILAWIFFATLTNSFQLPAQSPANSNGQPTYRYRAVDVGTLGGPDSSGCVPDCRYLNHQGTALLNSNTPAPDPFPSFCFANCYVTLGVVWWRGQTTVLNPLPGGVQDLPIWISDTDLVAGYSENGKVDPTTGTPEVIAALWLGGSPIGLGTFGGNASMANAVNNWGQVVGGATNATPDPLATDFYNAGVGPYAGFPGVAEFPFSTEMHAFLWDRGTLKDLKTLGGPDSFAEFINNRGQVAGFSFTNSTKNSTTGFPTVDPFLWENGAMKDLGTLGGTAGFAGDINNGGSVVGQSNLAGDATYHPFLWKSNHMTDLLTLGGNNGGALRINDRDTIVGWADLPGSKVHHAFAWQNGTMTDLGTVGTDPCSAAFSINARGQVVGDSGDGSGIETCLGKLHGFLWEPGGPMVDVSTLFAPLASGIIFEAAGHIGDDGSILGFGLLPNGDHHAMLLVPCDAHHEDASACYSNPGEAVGAGDGRAVPSL
jgi:probable HAF family extracellular repeat protein